MNRLLSASLVIARRDFIATVWSRTFLLFLLAPILAGAFGGLIGQLTAGADIEASHPTVVVVMDRQSEGALKAAHQRAADRLGTLVLPTFEYEQPEGELVEQAQSLLASEERNVSAVLSGTLAEPVLTAPARSLDATARELSYVLDAARAQQALERAGVRVADAELRTVGAVESSGRLNMVRHALARGAQLLIFFLTLMLATMLLSNLVEEKSSKVIEILAAAVPLDAIFFGKLVAMLGVSVIGVAVWGSLAGIGLLALNLASMPVTPAVGWPAFSLLLLLYFALNYMLLGAVFLGIGGQASNVREVQTLSMPITFAQVMIFLLASMAVGDDAGTIAWIAALFPLSSPMTMIAIAAQSDALWLHLPALLWQLLWVGIIIRVSARLFRRTVLKSGSSGGMFDWLRRPKRA